jgi:hypothetical protein
MTKPARMLSLAVGLLFFLGLWARADFSTAAKNLSNTATASKRPQVVCVPGTTHVYACWVENDGNDDFLYFRRSTNGGTTWSTPSQLTNHGFIQGDGAWYSCLSMAVEEPYVHIVFQFRVKASNDWEIFYARSPDMGANINNWKFTQLTDNSADSYTPDVAVSGGYVHVTYVDETPGNPEIMYKRITNHGGGAVDQTRRLTYSSTISWWPRIAARPSGGCLSIVYVEGWVDVNYSNIFYKHIENYGAGVCTTSKLTFTTTTDNQLPDIAVSSGGDEQYVYIVYQTYGPGNWEIMYKRLDNYGHAPFNTYTSRLSYTSTTSVKPAVDFDSSDHSVHISYSDEQPLNMEIMYRKFANYGGAGYISYRVSWNKGTSDDSKISVNAGSIYVIWSDATSGNFEILLKKGS